MKHLDGNEIEKGDIALMPDDIYLSCDFGLEDVDRMYEKRRALTVKEGDTVIVMIRYKDRAFLREMKIGKPQESCWIFPTARLEDVD